MMLHTRSTWCGDVVVFAHRFPRNVLKIDEQAVFDKGIGGRAQEANVLREGLSGLFRPSVAGGGDCHVSSG
eukprot:201503-Ditylum_brightwellii.AAC.1